MRHRAYEAAKKRSEPYNQIVGELPEMRRGTVNLVKTTIEKNRQTYVIVNNRLEGNAPLTIQALIRTQRGLRKIGQYAKW
jgi:hypothetical protein